MRALLLAVCVVLASAAPVRAADPVAASASRSLATMRASLRGADSLHARAIRDLTTGLRRGTTSHRETFETHASALALLAARAHTAAGTAATAFLDETSTAMAEASDDALRGSVPGAGGAIDSFVASVRRELERVRARADARVRGLARTFGHEDGAASLRARLPVWDFDLASAPSPSGTIPAPDAALRLRAFSAARLPDGRLVVAATGTAATTLDGLFDLRMRGAAVVVIPPRLADGGIAVNDAGTWSVAAEIGDPFQGSVPPAGNRVLQFGTEPFDGGLAGRQPGRLVAAGVFGLP